MVLLSEMEKEQVGKEIKRSALHCTGQASQMVLVVKNPPAKAGDIRDAVSIPGLGGCPGEVYGNPLQYSCLENPMNRGASQDRVHGVTKSWIWLKQLSNNRYPLPLTTLSKHWLCSKLFYC